MTTAQRLRGAWLVANQASGSTAGPVVAAIEAALAEAGAEIVGRTDFPARALPDAAALDAAGADTLVVLGGDGTINAVVDAVGDWTGQCLALPGGTMNMLPRTLHGDASPAAIIGAAGGARLLRLPMAIAGERQALCGIILGPVAAWVHAREGVRQHRLLRVIRAARLAWARSFGGNVRVVGLAGRHRAVLVTPDAGGLDVAAIGADGIADVVRLGWNWLLGDWRAAQTVNTARVPGLTLLGRRRVRALFDNGWLHLLVLEEGRVAARYRPGCAWDTGEDLRAAA